MQRLFIIGAIIGLGYGLIKFMKKSTKSTITEPQAEGAATA